MAGYAGLTLATMFRDAQDSHSLSLHSNSRQLNTLRSHTHFATASFKFC